MYTFYAKIVLLSKVDIRRLYKCNILILDRAINQEMHLCK